MGMNKLIDENVILEILDMIYDKALNGVPKVSCSVDELADDYLSKYPTRESAARHLIRYQLAKCGTSGFVAGLGGIVVLPVALPANMTNVLYVQMRMAAAVAKIGLTIFLKVNSYLHAAIWLRA